MMKAFDASGWDGHASKKSGGDDAVCDDSDCCCNL